MPNKTSVPRKGRPVTGHAQSAAERMRRLRERRRAAGLKAKTSWVPAKSLSWSSAHRIAEARSLAMHVLIARKIERSPLLLQTAHRNLARWRQQAQGTPEAWLVEWEALLAKPWRQVAGMITEQSEEATRLRQSSPFAGVLTETERKRILEAFRT